MSLKRPKGYRARTDAARKVILQRLLFIGIIVTILALILTLGQNIGNRSGLERREIREYFETGDFYLSYNYSRELLEEDPLNLFLLSVHGFSAYQLAVAQINNFETLSFLDESIWSLRKAMLINCNLPEVYYVLGKAYYHKGSSYADLAIMYLEKARDTSFMAADIPEYLGLSYASIGDYRSSIEAFALALNEDNSHSDMLLLTIARSYLALGEINSARAYLVRCINVSRDSNMVNIARLLLAGIIFDEGDYERAEAEYIAIIEESGENAEAFFKLGEIYLSQGDTTRARAEWRRALRVDPAYRPARNRLNL